MERLDINDPKNWTSFRIKKSDGTFRVIEVPCKALKEQLRRDIDAFLDRYNLRPWIKNPFNHGYCWGRSIITNAKPHVGKRYIYKMDIRDFFGSISYEKMAEIYAGCPFVGDDLRQFFKTRPSGRTYLPQGSPASPFIANLYLYRFDWKAGMMAGKSDIVYTRYVDNITFSGNDRKKLEEVAGKARNLLFKTFALRVKYAQLIPWYRKQKICGIVVNEKLNVDRTYRKILRAMLHQFDFLDEREKRRVLGMKAFVDSVQGFSQEVIDSVQYFKERKVTRALEKMGGEE